ncbi:hypothetical protein IU459_26945 [Nocardia amamiensis]|uniref:Minor tail protein gp31 C-terminal domain-containing protein n=1 Tax=Nocardia amamiensis TaxID=404578 RepID=A0ABS0D227_9NOCA|nr:hypothetical protein [Nocardia amamiensis]MBF6301153.1 hypothetical protein [Nocardia amamiensis]
MTVISEPISSIAGADNNTIFGFQSILDRESFDGTGMITTALYTVQAQGGVLTTANLDPGATVVYVGPRRYLIVVPDSEDPIRLFPLIQAGLPIPPAQEATAVRNGGGVARIQTSTQAAYNAIPTPDPETAYLING